MGRVRDTEMMWYARTVDISLELQSIYNVKCEWPSRKKLRFKALAPHVRILSFIDNLKYE